MSTEIDICNLALARLGDSATVASIDPPEGSAQADHCARFYPIARGVVLESHNWLFSTKRKRLALLSADAFNWSYAYAVPSNSLKIISVLPYNGGSEDESQEYEIEAGDSSNVILTNQGDAVAKFTELVTDPARYSNLVVDALAWLVGAYVGGPLLKGDVGVAASRACFSAYQVAIEKAKAFDANQRRVRPEHTPDWIGAR